MRTESVSVRPVLLAGVLTAAVLLLLPALPLEAAAPPPEVVDATVEGLPEQAGFRTLDVDAASAPVEAPIPFSMVGFTVPDGTGLEYRTSVDGETWTPWLEAEALGVDDDGPEAGSDEDAGDWQRKTEPAWVGEAAWIQTRGAEPGEVEVHLIDSDGLSESLGARVSRAAQGVAAAVATPAVAQASDGRPSIVSREQWGADESWRRSPSYASLARYAVVHHTAGSNSYTREQAPAVVRGIYSYHARTLGWSDIGYNVLVDRYGTIYEGRAGGLHRPVIGAHARGFNTGSIGVSIMGDFTGSAPPQAAQQAVADVLSWKFDLHGIIPEGQITVRSGGSNKYPSGTEVRIPTIIGHRDVGLTACPGNAYYPRLDWLRGQVRDDVYERQTSLLNGCPNPEGLSRIAHAAADELSWAAGRWYFSGVDEAVVASGEDYADALAGAVLAAERGAPILLTDSDGLSAGARRFLAEEGIGTVWLLGGPAAVSRDVERAIAAVHGASGPAVAIERVAGADRFETAAAVAAEVGGGTGEVAIALGRHAEFDRAWPDALGAASLAATPDRVPTLLTRADRVPEATLAALEALGVERVHVLGGSAAVSDAVLAELRGRGLEVARLAGRDRYATGVAVAEEALSRFDDPTPRVTFASGRSYTHALVAGGVAGRRGGPLLLVPPDDLERSTELVAHLRDPSVTYGDAVLVGSATSVVQRVSLQLCGELQ